MTRVPVIPHTHTRHTHTRIRAKYKQHPCPQSFPAQHEKHGRSSESQHEKHALSQILGSGQSQADFQRVPVPLS